MSKVDLHDDCSIEASEDTVAREVNGEAVLLQQESEQCFSLDVVSTTIWRTLTESQSLGQALLKLEKEFGVDQTRLRVDLEPFVDALVSEGLAVVRPSASA
jgi:hypothetical protein